MGKVGTGFSMSLDGFVAGPNDEVDHVFAWMFAGQNEVTVSTGDHDIDLKLSSESTDIFETAATAYGALVSGRHLFDITDGWGGKHPMNVPVVVLSHTVPQAWIDAHPDAPFTFVTDNLESAINKAKQIAGDKGVAIASPTLVQQAIQAGLLEEIHIDLVPVLLGDGKPLFGTLGISPLELTIDSVVQAPGVTHLNYTVKK